MRASTKGSSSTHGTSRIAKHAEFALGIKKSKRSWTIQRFAVFECRNILVTSGMTLIDQRLIIRQLIKEAQLARRPVRFLAIHDLDDFRVVVTSTTKGKKTWLAIKIRYINQRVMEIS